MSDRLKKVLFALFFVVFTIGVGIGIYYVFFKPVSTPGAVIGGSGGGGTLPGAGAAGERTPTIPGEAGGLTGAETIPGVQQLATQEIDKRTSLIKEGVVQQISPDANGLGARYYDPIESKFYKIDADGAKKELSATLFPNVQNVAWGKNSDQAIIEFPDGSKVHYNFSTGKQTTIPKHWQDFDFAQDDASVVAKSMAVAPESRFLIIASPDGSGARAIEPVGENADKVTPVWATNNQIIAYATVGEAKGMDRQQILMVGKNHENITGLLVEGRGFEPLWSPSGQTVLYSAWSEASAFRPELWISGGASGNMNENRRKLELQTWVNKCVWADENTIYCAVPDTLPRGAGLQPELFSDTPDTIIKIDLRDGSKTSLGKPAGDLSVRSPVITADGKKLIFSDTVRGDLFTFNLE